MKVLVFGKTGQVATELQRQADVIALGRDHADLSDPAACARAIAEYEVDAVIKAATDTAVDKAEEEEALATVINGDAPAAMAQAAAEMHRNGPRWWNPRSAYELEITTLLEMYLHEGLLSVERMGRSYAWLDTGTHSSLLDAGNFVRTLEVRQGLQIGSPDEIAFDSGWIDADQLRSLAKSYSKNRYGRNLAEKVEVQKAEREFH